MTVAPDHRDTTVFVVGSDAALVSAIERLLSLDPDFDVVGTATNPLAVPPGVDAVVDDELLTELRALSVGEFIDAIKALPPKSSQRHLRPIPGAREGLLSQREIQVVRLIAEGLANKEISRRLGLSDKTVKNHISHILAKLQLTARTQVAVHALRTGLV